MLSVPGKQPRGKNHSLRSMECINQKILKKPKRNKQKKSKIFQMFLDTLTEKTQQKQLKLTLHVLYLYHINAF